MRPVTLEPSPVFHPFKCIRCKIAAGPIREYFIDLGLDISGEFNPMYDGNIYYCNKCAKNLVVDLIKIIQQWDLDHSPWEDDDKATITYDWERQIDLSGINGAIASGGSEGTEIDNLPTERDDSVPEPTTTISDGTVSDVSGDEPSSLSVSRDGFTGF